MLTPEEQKIAEYGKQQGKTKEQVLSAISKYRSENGINPQTTQPAQPSEPGFLSGVAQDFNTRVNNAADAQVSALEGKQSDTSAALQTVGQGAGFIGDLIGRGINTLTGGAIGGAIKAGSSLVPQKVADVGGDAVLKYQDWSKAHPEAAANLESAFNLGSLLPVGGGIAKGAQSGTKSALVGAGKALEATADASTGVSKAIKGAGSALYKTAITPTVQEAQRILNYRAKTPFLKRSIDGTGAPLTRGQTALERGLAGTESMIGVQAKRAADDLWTKEIAPAVANSKGQMTKDELFTPALERIASIEDPTRRAAMQRAYDALLEDYKAYPEAFDLTKAQALKRDLAAFTPTKIFKGQDVASEMRTLQADMADAIRQKTYETLKDENIRKKYLDWANLDELQKVGIKAISNAKVKGGSGTLIGGLWDMATVPAKTIGGQVLYRVGDALEFTAPKGIKTLGQYLQKMGYSKPTEYQLPKSELSAGLSVKDVSKIPKSVTPERVAKMMDSEDYIVALRWKKNPADKQNFGKAMRLFDAIGIGEADDATINRFLDDVFVEINSSKPQ